MVEQQATRRNFMRMVSRRSRLMLEIASELVAARDWAHPQIRLTMRDQGAESWGPTFFASDSPDSIHEVAKGTVQLAIVNPGSILNMALKGTGPFRDPVPVRAITILGQHDQLVLGVSADTGLTSLEDIRDKRYPLKVSLRGQMDHSVHLVVDEMLKAAGFSLDDIKSWGGEVRYDNGLPSNNPNRIGAVERGEITAIFDEAAGWRHQALKIGMRIIPIGEETLSKLEALGLQRGIITKESTPGLPEDVPTIDFSGWIIYVRDDMPDDEVWAICAALEARKDRIPPGTGEPPLPLDRMCKDTPEGRLPIPLHPAAERFWREQGYLS